MLTNMLWLLAVVVVRADDDDLLQDDEVVEIPITSYLGQAMHADLAKAAKRGTLAEVEALIARGAPVNGTNGNGISPLFGASYAGNLGIVEALLAAGANVNSKSSTGDTALHYATMSGRGQSAEVVKALLAAGANPGWHIRRMAQISQTGAEGAEGARGQLPSLDGTAMLNEEEFSTSWAPLHRASGKGYYDVVEALLIAGANVDVVTRLERYTPLHRAADHGFALVAYLLLVLVLLSSSRICCLAPSSIISICPLRSTVLMQVSKTTTAMMLLPWQVSSLVVLVGRIQR